MLFNSIQFLLFFPFVAILYFAIPHRFRHLWLLLASYVFYICWNPKYSLLLLTSTVITYISGILIGKEVDKKSASGKKKLWVALSIILNLVILGFFKYFDFAIDNINVMLRLFNITLIQPSFDIVLPVGISFYTFKALAYSMDVYRGDIKPEKDFLKYALFVSFFPQLMSGPIERPTNFLPQLEKKQSFNYERMKSGLLLMIWGFFLKMVLSDRLAILVNKVFDNCEDYGGFQIALAVVFFGLQIYCDFASYTNIALGAGQIMGFKLMDNFNTPYFAESVSDFWRRWHISLSTWFRDYLYIPLGGNRKGKLRKYFNILVVFLISGLWHGANWNFIIWGGLNGVYQIIGDIFKPVRSSIIKKLKIIEVTFSNKLIKIVTTFALVDFAWIFFRAKGAKEAFLTIKQMFSTFNPYIFFNGSVYKLGLDRPDFWIAILSLGILFIVSLCKYNGIHLREKLSQQNTWFRWLVYYSMIFVVLIFGIYGPGYDAAQFIYSKF